MTAHFQRHRQREERRNIATLILILLTLAGLLCSSPPPVSAQDECVDWHWYVGHDCAAPGAWCRLELQLIADSQVSRYFSTILGSYGTEAQARQATCAQMSDPFDVNGQAAVYPGVKATIAGEVYDVGTFISMDAEGHVTCYPAQPDADNDGVPDNEDWEAGTRAGAPVNPYGSQCTPATSVDETACTVELRCIPYADEEGVRSVDLGDSVECVAAYDNPDAEEVHVRAYAGSIALFDALTTVKEVDVGWEPTVAGRHTLVVEVTYLGGRLCQGQTIIEARGSDSRGGPTQEDRDGDGLRDSDDRCPDEYGTSEDGCPSQPEPETTDTGGDRTGSHPEGTGVQGGLEEILAGKGHKERTPGEKAAAAAATTALITSGVLLSSLLNSGMSLAEALSRIRDAADAGVSNIGPGVAAGFRWPEGWGFFKKVLDRLGRGAANPKAGSGRAVFQKGSPYYRTADELADVQRKLLERMGHSDRYAREVTKLMNARGKQAARISDLYVEMLRYCKAAVEGMRANEEAGKLAGVEAAILDHAFNDPISAVEKFVMTDKSPTLVTWTSSGDTRPAIGISVAGRLATANCAAPITGLKSWRPFSGS